MDFEQAPAEILMASELVADAAKYLDRSVRVLGRFVFTVFFSGGLSSVPVVPSHYSLGFSSGSWGTLRDFLT